MIVGMALKFYAIDAKGLKLKLKKFWGLILMFVAVMGGRLVWGGGGQFLAPHILNRVKTTVFVCFSFFPLLKF